jgi:hypothetical protein
VEVLVAIFIMAIGLLTLLTLFPLGALSMAQAIKDERSSQAAANAIALAHARSYRNDGTVTGNRQGRDYFIDPGNGLPRADDNGPSYPVFVDPLGKVLLQLRWDTIADIPDGIPRRSVDHIDDPGLDPNERYRRSMAGFTLQDDMRFHRGNTFHGLPSVPGGPVERYDQYSWAYLLQRPRAADTSVVNVSVVVYSGRTLQILGETAYRGVAFDTNSNMVRVTWNPTKQDKPPIRKGSWILDATLVNSASRRAEPHGYFYRVVGVTDESANSMLLELQSNPKKGTANGILVVMENVVEVFERGAGWQP